ncbi:hypothetical protein [Parapedobacter sp. DT-150]
MNLFEDTYKKGSKFIAYAYPLKEEVSVKELVTALKSQHLRYEVYIGTC